MEILGYFSAVLMGLLLGIVGGGGSILTVPILIYFFGQGPLSATTGSLLVVGLIAFVGAILSARKGLVDFSLGLYFAVPSFLGVFVARHYLLPALPEIIQVGDQSISKGLVVLFSFSILMLAAGKAMIQGPRAQENISDSKNSFFQIGIKGFFVGLATGFVGAGGGFLIIPALVLLLKMPMKKAVGTSLAIIAASSLFGFSISDLKAAPPMNLLLTIVLIGTAGLVAGHKLAGKIPEKNLKKAFGIFVVLISIAMLAQQTWQQLKT